MRAVLLTDVNRFAAMRAAWGGGGVAAGLEHGYVWCVGIE